MENKQAILEILEGYMTSFHSDDFDRLYTFYYEPEVIQLRELFIGLAKGLEPFGENQSLYASLKGIEKIEDLDDLSPKQFLKTLMRYSVDKLEPEKVKAMVDSLEILEIDETEYFAQVEYQMNNSWSDEGEPIIAELQMLNTELGWKILFRPGAKEQFQAQQAKIDGFNERKAKDHPNRTEQDPEDLEVFALHGYRNYSDEIIIEPRFSQAENFSEGLALVRAFSLWGYIDLSGEFAIRPAFHKANSFAFERALVGQYDMHSGALFYWFIDTSGKPINALKFTEAASFQEGLAAVCVDKKWGFLRTDGTWLIEPQFDQAYSFDDGEASVQIYKPDGEIQ